MKIAISYDNRLPYTTGNYFFRAFRNIGCEVHYFHPTRLNEINPKDYQLFIKIDDGLENNRWRSDLHPSIYYVIDTHLEKWRFDMASEGKFDMLFVAQKNATEFPEWHVKPIWCPLGCDRDLHFIGNRAKEYDVCFIGNFHSMYQNTRLEYVDALFKKFPNFYYGNRAFYEMAEKFRSSKIVFNHAINNDINMRFFEACCSGSFQLAPYIDNNGLEELFQDGVHLVTYKSIKNALDLAEFYLNNEEAREKIAKAGMIHINNNHTYIHRTKAIMKEAERVLL